MAVDETSLVAEIRDEILKIYPDAWARKIHGNIYQRAGMPDLLVAIEGRLFGIEVKKIRRGESHAHAIERATVLQREEIRKIRRAGGTAGVVTSAMEALELIRAGLAAVDGSSGN